MTFAWDANNLHPVTTPARRLADHLLGASLEQWVRERRERGDSWKRIATELHAATYGQVDIVAETLRLWFRNDQVHDVTEATL